MTCVTRYLSSRISLIFIFGCFFFFPNICPFNHGIIPWHFKFLMYTKNCLSIVNKHCHSNSIYQYICSFDSLPWKWREWKWSVPLPQSLLDVGIASLEVGCLFYLLNEENVIDGRGWNGQSVALCPLPTRARIQPSWQFIWLVMD